MTLALLSATGNGSIQKAGMTITQSAMQSLTKKMVQNHASRLTMEKKDKKTIGLMHSGTL